MADIRNWTRCWSAEIFVIAYILMIGGLMMAGGSGGRLSLPPEITEIESKGGMMLVREGEPVRGKLGPATGIEVRFEDEQVGKEAVGRESVKLPFVLDPPVKGSFTWLSRRSGMFQPDEPYLMNTRYAVRITGELAAEFRTPPMHVENDYWQSWHLDSADRLSINLRLNMEVDPKRADEYFVFQDKNGREIEAEVKLARKGAYEELAREDLEWADRFTWDRYPEQRDPLSRKGIGRERDVPVSLQVKPVRPLPAGNGWVLLTRKGLPSADGSVRMPSEYRVKLGNIRPNRVEGVFPRNVVNEGRSIHVRLARPVSEEVVRHPERWLHLNPPVGNLKVERGNRWMALRGDFELGVKYNLRVAPGLPDEGGRKLDKVYDHQVRFHPLSSRIYFSARSNAQYSGGHRCLRFVSVNNPRSRVRVKLIDEKYLTGTLAGYQRVYPERAGYFHGKWQRGNGNPLSFEVVPGEVVFDEDFNTGDRVDHARKVDLSWNDLLKGRKAGVAFVQVEGLGDRGAVCVSQVVVQLTDLGVAWKSSGEQLLAWVFSQKTGQPVPGAKVSVLRNKGEKIEAASDEDGLAWLPGPVKGGWLRVDHGGDILVQQVDGSDHRASVWNFGLFRPWDRNDPPKAYLEMFSDRGVYRPGEVVHLKGVARHPSGKNIGGANGTVICTDSRDETLLRREINLSSNGSFNLDINLPDGGALGRHYVTVKFEGGREAYHSFQVQEFQPDTFKIKIGKPDDLPPGSPLDFPLSAKYYFGAPLAKVKAKWVMRASRAYLIWFEDLEGYEFNHDEILGDDIAGAEFVLRGETDLDSNGETRIKPDLQPDITLPVPMLIETSVTLTDLNQQTLSASQETVRHSSSFYLGIREMPDVVYAGRFLPLSVVAVTPDGAVKEEPVKARVLLKRIEWQSVPMRGAGGVMRFQNEKQIIQVAEKEILTVQKGIDVDLKLAPPRAGEYLLEVHAEDDAGRQVLAAQRFHVSGSEPLAWDYRNEFQVSLVPDKSVYQPGETARLLVKTPISGRALITLERGGIRRARVVNLEGNAPVVEVRVGENDAPNMYVSVLILKGAEDSRRKVKAAECRLGYAALKVANPGRRLEVEFDDTGREYRPGQEVVVQGIVRDSMGVPVPKAEVTLYAVDEGILSLTSLGVPDLRESFSRKRPHNVDTFTLFPLLLSEDLSRGGFGNKGHLIGGGGSSVVKVGLRKDFLPCAYWNAALFTDPNGRVKAKFKAPDSLTKYRVMAVVHAGDRYGSAYSSFEVSKPLMVETALPTVGRVGDRLWARAVVHNRTDADQKVRVTLKAGTLMVVDGRSSKELFLAARSSQPVEFPVELRATGELQAEWTAKSVDDVGLVDGLVTQMKIHPAAPLLREIHFASTNEGEIRPLEDFNPQLLEGEAELTLRLGNTRLLQLNEAADFLLRYPYGCVEQTSSSLLPWLYLEDLKGSVPALDRPREEVRPAIQGGVQRLLKMQTHSGGLGYWPGANTPMLWGTAYGGLALVMARESGAVVPVRALDRIGIYLSRALRKTRSLKNPNDLGARCLAVYVLGLMGKAEPGYLEVLYEKRASLKREDRAILALAMVRANGSDGRVPVLLRRQNMDEEGSQDSFGGRERTAAIELLAWVHHRPKSPVTRKLVGELLDHRVNGHWRTTQGNAWSMMALAEYGRLVEGEMANAEALVTWEGREKKIVLGQDQRWVEMRFSGKDGVMLGDVKILSSGKLYVQSLLESRPQGGVAPAQNRGFALHRTYEHVEGKREWRVGDLVKVSLHLDVPKDASYVAIDDPLPSILEAVNQEFVTRANRDEVVGVGFWTDHSEIRADRVLFFRDRLLAGRYRQTYLARVRAAGEVIAPAAKVEEMYQPSRQGLSASKVLSAQPLD
ncbi:MAG: hypothetical protein CMO66_04900 [Verrucomicrobiales bacterium]|nr:hypothetical protein [Verrucomicrobiales bacterium]